MCFVLFVLSELFDSMFFNRMMRVLLVMGFIIFDGGSGIVMVVVFMLFFEFIKGRC